MSSVRTRAVAACLLVVSLLGCAPGCADALDKLLEYQDYQARRESSFDRSGGNLDMRPVDPGETLVLADLNGPGCVTHIWFTYMYPSRSALRKLVVRAYFDGAETPCIESPLGDFFGLGHSQVYSYASEALAVGTHAGLNSFWKMPFAKHARFTITNEGRQRCQALYYYIDYRAYDKPQPKMPCFHAIYHQATPCLKGEPYVILEAKGRGHYVGCNLSIEQMEDSWWGEGDDRFFIDGETTPSLWGTGSEDYFSGAWCYMNEFAFPYLGMPLRGRLQPNGELLRVSPDLRGEALRPFLWPTAWQKGDLWNVYRYHIQDPIPFRKSLRMEIEHGFINNERQDSYSSVAYWYQSEPHAPQPALPPVKERVPLYLRPQDRGNGVWEAEDFADETSATEGQVLESGMDFWGNLVSRKTMLEWNPSKDDSQLTLPLPVAAGGRYELALEVVRTRRGGRFEVLLDDKVATGVLELFQDSIFPERRKEPLGEMELTTGTHELAFHHTGKHEKSEARQLAIDIIHLRPLK